MLISIIVPCYNEEEALPLFKAAFDCATKDMRDVSFELLLVDDGSTDRTLAVAEQLSASDPCVKTLSFSRNFGKEAALLAGLANATGDMVALMDADLQDPPSLLPRMHGIMVETGCDCVATRRVTRVGEPPVRSFFARAFYRLINQITPVEIVDGARDFRLMRREMVNAILTLTEHRRFSKGLFAWVGFDVRYIEYENVARVAGVTKWSFWSLLQYALEGFFSMTTAPLALPTFFMVLTFIAAVILAILGLWPTALACVTAGLILLGLGVFGQYVARVYWETTKRPLYILKKDK